MKQIDINCDYGESYGSFRGFVSDDILKYISSVNIACGFHAGDFRTMEQSVKQAMQHNVKIGAHPGFPDLQGFGRRFMQMTPKEVYQIVVYQIGALSAFVKAEGGRLNHVKPHGALYNLAAKDLSIALAIAEAVYKTDNSLTLYGLAKSELITAGKEVGLAVAEEAFADRTYQADGSLTPRTEKNAIVTSIDEAIDQVVHCIKHDEMRSVCGNTIKLAADTYCIHGDTNTALSLAKQLTYTLKKENIIVG
ncbi:lactam utilization protein LamB [Lottiidibacillus patelloidae]|uniref:5-oxoprolinase subunit A n=1 Tax=Lottiidibacillus patelloidae TaxID=2670334 RepID=A0A263BX36_9BACI|nr:5-oxoprolinase subunit PxpA [Lottiidibacillus patelloidae]OZM58303.1 lactam utilization protein LamB [Lottiidibacillus patelloidae]